MPQGFTLTAEHLQRNNNGSNNNNTNSKTRDQEVINYVKENSNSSPTRSNNGNNSGRVTTTPSRMIEELRNNNKNNNQSNNNNDNSGANKSNLTPSQGRSMEVIIGKSRDGTDDDDEVDEGLPPGTKSLKSMPSGDKNKSNASNNNNTNYNAQQGGSSKKAIYQQKIVVAVESDTDDAESNNSSQPVRAHNNSRRHQPHRAAPAAVASSPNKDNNNNTRTTKSSNDDKNNIISAARAAPLTAEQQRQAKAHDDELMDYALRSSALPDSLGKSGSDRDGGHDSSHDDNNDDDDSVVGRRRGDAAANVDAEDMHFHKTQSSAHHSSVDLRSKASASNKGSSSHNSSSHNDKIAQLRRCLRLVPGKDRDDLIVGDIDEVKLQRRRDRAGASLTSDDDNSTVMSSSTGTNLPGEMKTGGPTSKEDQHKQQLEAVANDLEECASNEDRTMRFFAEIAENPFIATIVIEAQSQTVIWVNEFATFLFNLVESDLVGQDVSIIMGPVPGRDNKAFHHKKIGQYLHRWSQTGAQPDSKIASGRVQELLACRFEGIKRIPFMAQLSIRPLRMSARDDRSPPVMFVGFFRDYSPEKALKIALSMNRFSIASSTEPILVMNTRGQIKEMNEACAELFGYDQEFLIETEANIKLFMPEAYAREHDRYLKTFREKLATPGFDIRTSPIIAKDRVLTGRRADGAEFPIQLRVELHIDNTRSGNDRLIGYIRDRRALIKAQDFNLEVSKRLFPESIAKLVSQKEKLTFCEQYRNMPVILIDMVGFTNLTRNLDNESVFNLVNDMYKSIAEIATGYQVEVAKCTGDGVIAVCGLDEFDERKSRMDRAVCFGLNVLRWAQKEERPLRIGIGYGDMGSGIMHCSSDGQRPSWDIWGTAVTESSFLENQADTQTLHTTAKGYHAVVDFELQGLFRPKNHPNGPGKGMVHKNTEKKFLTYQTNPGLDHKETLDITEKVKNAAMSRIYLKKENARDLKEQQERRALTQG